MDPITGESLLSAIQYKLLTTIKWSPVQDPGTEYRRLTGVDSLQDRPKAFQRPPADGQERLGYIHTAPPPEVLSTHSVYLSRARCGTGQARRRCKKKQRKAHFPSGTFLPLDLNRLG